LEPPIGVKDIYILAEYGFIIVLDPAVNSHGNLNNKSSISEKVIFQGQRVRGYETYSLGEENSANSYTTLWDNPFKRQASGRVHSQSLFDNGLQIRHVLTLAKGNVRGGLVLWAVLVDFLLEPL